MSDTPMQEFWVARDVHRLGERLGCGISRVFVKVSLVLDLRNVNYASSGGLVAFQTIAGRAVRKGGKAVFAGLTKRVSEVFRISGFNQILSIYPDLATAQASFQ